MPKQYEAMRDEFIRQGLGRMAAKKRAAKIYNSKHHSDPVTSTHNSSGRYGLGNRDNRDNRDNSGGRDE